MTRTIYYKNGYKLEMNVSWGISYEDAVKATIKALNETYEGKPHKDRIDKVIILGKEKQITIKPDGEVIEKVLKK